MLLFGWISKRKLANWPVEVVFQRLAPVILFALIILLSYGSISSLKMCLFWSILSAFCWLQRYFQFKQDYDKLASKCFDQSSNSDVHSFVGAIYLMFLAFKSYWLLANFVNMASSSSYFRPSRVSHFFFRTYAFFLETCVWVSTCHYERKLTNKFTHGQ